MIFTRFAAGLKKVLLLILLSAICLPSVQAEDNQLTMGKMGSKRIRLSHIDPNRCIQILQLYGVNIGKPGQPVQTEELPVIVPLPGTALHQTVGAPGANLPLTESDPLNELIVFYDQNKPEILSEIINTIEQIIDIPARQIIIEAMILEITEKSLNQLGVQWNLLDSVDPLQSLAVGQLPISSDFSPTVDMSADRIFGEFGMKLKALVESGSAEILSRPSILTLNNRMAYINVSQQIPVAEGQLNRDGILTSVNFKEKMAGIQLGVRPRISKNEREVGMQISASVSAIVPNEDVELKNSDGDILASSPTISIREVKTYARIANNMPFIIGGLVAKDDVEAAAEVPLLGRLPYLGRLFRNEAISHQKREVIIVITPYILPEEETTGTQIGEKSITLRTLPRDDPAFDSFGNRLFRPSCRIRSTDVFDLNFLTENEQLKKMQDLADRIVVHNVLLKNLYPWRCFVDGHVPGEEILVFRQMYEVIKRTGLEEQIQTQNIAFLGQGRLNGSGFQGQYLNNYLEQTATRLWEEAHPDASPDLHPPQDLWARMGKHAIAITYTMQNKSTDPEHMLNEPAPTVQIVDCPDAETRDTLLWDLNQPTETGRERHSMIISGPKDITRIKRSILLHQTAELNANQKSMTLENFTVGQNLLLPGMNTDQVIFIDSEVAKYYFYSDQFYQALRQELDKDIKALQEEIGIDP